MGFSPDFYTDLQVDFKRNTSPADVNYSDTTGEYQTGQFEIVKIDCCIRSKGSISENRINGRIENHDLIVYTKDPVYTDRGDLVADCMIWNGCNYAVTEVVDNNNSFIPHYRAICVKEEVPR